MSETAVIVAGKRTPIGAFQGSLASLPAPRIAAPVLRELTRQMNVEGSQISEVIMGEVLSAGVGQAPARQALIYADIPNSVPALTLNKVCGSGLKAIMLARQSILTGESEIVLAGGMESMTNAPYMLPKARAGVRMGNDSCVDSMIHDGLWDCYNNFHMGQAGELCAKQAPFTREQQDDFAIESYQRARASVDSGHFKKEIVPLTVKGKKGEETVEKDDSPFKSDLAKIPSLKPAFDKNGTITAANASSIADGAAACMVTTETWAKKKNVTEYFRIVATSYFAHQPEWFTTAPIGALKRLEKTGGVKLENIDAIEINEAFAVVPMIAMRDLKLSEEQVNPRGGAIALGHPIGASGARILVTLMNHLSTIKKRYGAATLCIGGGEAVAVLIERVGG